MKQMKITAIKYFAMCAWLACLVPACSGADNIASPAAQVVIGDTTKGADLPAAILNAYASGARDITIRPGTYRIPLTGKYAIPLEQWKNATIHAKGVTIIFEELAQRPIYLNRCENVTWEGVTLQFAEPSFTQGRVKAMGEDAQGKYLDWQIDAGYPIFDAAKSTFDVVDQKTRLLKTGTGDMGCKSAESLGAGLYRLRNIYGGLGPTAVNDWIFTRRPDGGSSIIHLDGCSRCTMRGITLQNSGFAAFFETGGAGGHHYVDCRIAPGPKPVGATEEQLVGCGADGFHSAGVRIGPTFERCVWEGVLHDDCIAIHGSLQKIIRAEGNKLILEKGNRSGFVAGEPVRISSAGGFFGEFTCTALRVLTDEGGLLELTLDRKSGAPAEAKASNPRNNGAGYKILNCTMGNCRSRGILVKADNGLIEGCTISGCGMSAISIGPEYYWGEADYSKNVTIRGNKLLNNVLNGSEAGVIFVHGDGAMGNGNLTITGNLFDKDYGQIAIHAEDTDGIRIADNRFIASPIPLPNQTRTILDFKSAKNIVLKNNVVENSAKSDTLVKLGKNVEGVTGNDTNGITLAAADAVAVANAGPEVHDGSPSDSNLRYIGRWDRSNPQVRHSYWSTAYLRAAFTGTTVKAKVSGGEMAFIDGRRVQFVACDGGINLTPQPLPPRRHTLLLASAGQNEELLFRGLILDSGAVTEPVPAKPLIEFVGDSITACEGKGGTGDENYAWQAAASLGCDLVRVAFSGVALKTGYGFFGDKTGFDQWYFKFKNCNHTEDQMPWDWSYDPQMVVINLGTNDAKDGQRPTDAEFAVTYADFIRAIRARLPKAEIVAMRPFGGFQAGGIRQAVESLASSDRHLHYVDTSGWLVEADFVDGIHPSVEGHAKAALLLAKALKPWLPR